MAHLKIQRYKDTTQIMIQNTAKAVDLTEWEGDKEELIGYEDELAYNADLCEQIFMSEHEAFLTGLFLAKRQSEQPQHASLSPQFDQQARDESLELIERLPWGDIEGAIETFEESMLLAMEATRDDFARWEAEGEGERRFGNEFNLSPRQVEELDDAWRLAYVARDSPAALLHGLDDIGKGVKAS
jgi:hypothetical protein